MAPKVNLRSKARANSGALEVAKAKTSRSLKAEAVSKAPSGTDQKEKLRSASNRAMLEEKDRKATQTRLRKKAAGFAKGGMVKGKGC